MFLTTKNIKKNSKKLFKKLKKKYIIDHKDL